MILTQTNNYGIYLPVRWIISQTPHGVAGNMEYWSRHIRPTLITWKPSTSLSGETALQIFRSSMCSEREIKAAAWSHCCILALPDSSLSGLSCKPIPPPGLFSVIDFLVCTEGTHTTQSQMPTPKAVPSCATASLRCRFVSRSQFQVKE